MTNDAQTTLHDLISRFEIPRADADFSDLIACLVEEAVHRATAGLRVTEEDNAKYFYLLGRVYELLGYSARHTPWLSNSPRFYWHKALGFLEEAMVLAPTESPFRRFLYGKLLFREATIFTLDTKSADPSDNSEDLLAEAETEFDAAAERESDLAVQYLYRDAALMAQTEREQRSFRKELQGLLYRAMKKPSSAALEAIVVQLQNFPRQPAWEFPSAAAGMAWAVQHALAKVRPLYAKAQMYEEVAASIRDIQKKHQDASFGMQLLNDSEKTILACHEESAKLCDAVGLTIRAADSQVTRLHREAEASLRHCRRQFTTVQARENSERTRLLERAGALPRFLAHDAVESLKNIPPGSDPIRVPQAFIDAAFVADVSLDNQAVVFSENEHRWIVKNGSDRYLVDDTDALPQILNLEKQPIPFSDSEADTFNKYALDIRNTCKLYTQAIREILGVLEAASSWYDDMTSHLQTGIKSAANDAHLASLHVTIRSIQREVNVRNYPLLATLRVRARYAWSLLEMFQMRNRSVRLGTLFSGQCQLIMANPFYEPETDVVEDKFLEVGADPIFQTTIDFIFRGAKGERNRHDFQRRALRTTKITIDQQEQSLLVESRYLDLDADTRRALIARLACHRSLALALEQFTDIFVAQRAGQMSTGTIRRFLSEIQKYFSDAQTSLDASGDYQSKLIDRTGLDALHDYMKGIAQVLIGMNDREQKRPWASTYRKALGMLDDARKKLKEVGDVYLLPPGDVRVDYLNYVEARVLTVTAFRDRYLGEEDDSPSDFASAAALFERSAEIFEKLHDYRVATKARARAADARSLAENGPEPRYQWLKEANALYAACADEAGYKNTFERLQEEFSEEEAGLFSKTSSVQRPRVSTSRTSSPPLGNKETFGSYELERIGHGGMADVYRAKIDNGRIVALKRISPRYLGYDDYRERFRREFQTGKMLTHPNIIAIHDYGEINGVPYFTMEYLDGRTLEIFVAAHETFRPRRAAQVVRQVAEGLAFAHRKGVMHRDLTPANIMMLANSRVKIMDFGVARDTRFERLTKGGQVLGTPLYASPDYLTGSDATPSSDLYALGVIAYELLTGQSVLSPQRRLREDQPPPSKALPGLPPVLDTIISKLLARDVSKRYVSADALIADLDEFLSATSD